MYAIIFVSVTPETLVVYIEQSLLFVLKIYTIISQFADRDSLFFYVWYSLYGLEAIWFHAVL